MRNLRIITVVNAIFFAGNGAGMAFFTLLLEGLGASYAQISLIVSVQILSAIATNIVYSRYADKLGARRRWLVAGLLLLGLGYLSLGLSTTLAWATLSRAIEGVGAALYATTSLALIGQLLKDSPKRGRSMGFIRGVGSLTFAVGSLAGGFLARRYGIEMTFYLGTLLYFTAAMIALLLAPGAQPRPALASPVEALAQAARPLQSDPAAASRRRLPWIFLGSVIVLMLAHTASATFFPNYLKSLDQDVAIVGSLWALTAALEFPAMILVGALADTMGRGLLLALGAWLLSIVNILYVAAPRIPFGFVIAQLLRAPGISSYFVNGMAYTAERSTESDRVLNSGIFNLAQSGGQLMGVLLGGLLVQMLGFQTLYVMCASLTAVAGIGFIQLRRPRYTSQPQSMPAEQQPA